MIRRMLVLALIAVFAVVLAGGCSDTQEETIEFTIRDYYSAYNAQAWDVCLGHIDDTSNVGASFIQSALEESRAAMGKVTVDSIENVSISGLSATADVRITYGDHSETKVYPLVKKDGSWKISYPGG